REGRGAACFPGTPIFWVWSKPQNANLVAGQRLGKRERLRVVPGGHAAPAPLPCRNHMDGESSFQVLESHREVGAGPADTDARRCCVIAAVLTGRAKNVKKANLTGCGYKKALSLRILEI